jgi:hypothetical protein
VGEMIAAILVALLATGEPPEPLPLDSAIAALEVAVPSFKGHMAAAEEDIARWGAVEPGWATSGMSAAAVIEDAKGQPSHHVLGEWEKGGHGVIVAGNHPLKVPSDWHRYAVRNYSGPIDQHAYFRISPDLVIHTYGAATRIGNATCRATQGVELFSRHRWQSWSPETMLMGFGMARSTRDDPDTYCSLFRATGNGKYLQLSYTPEGRPFLIATEDPQSVVITLRSEAIERMFSQAEPSRSCDDHPAGPSDEEPD